MGKPHAPAGGEQTIAPIEHELTMHIERAHELSERARRSNSAAQHEIERARAIAGALTDRLAAARGRR